MLNKTEIETFKVELKKLPIEEFLELKEVPMQRDTEGRAKTTKVKKMLKTLRAPHLEISLVKLTKECIYYGKVYAENSIFIVNGNTRKFFWKNGLSNKIPSHVNASIYLVENMEEVRELYNMFDNPDSQEKNQQKVYGILTGLYNFYPTCQTIIRGALLTGLHFACYKLNPGKYNQPSINPQSLPFEIKEYIEEIKAFDKICTTPGNWDQALICSALMSMKRYGTTNPKLLECFDRIDGRKMDTTTSKQDGATHICVEWKSNEKFVSKGTSWSKPNGFSQTVPFALYWIEKYMKDIKQMQIGGGWETTSDNWFNEYHAFNTTLSNIVNETTEIEKEFLITS